MKVKRYGDTLIGIKEMDDGKWVSHDDYAALLKERDALAAENAGLRRFISGSCYVFDGDHDDDMPDEFVDASHYMPIVTPATDAAIANIQAQGLEKYACSLESSADDAERDGYDDAVKFLRSEASGVRLFASQLRKESNHD